MDFFNENHSVIFNGHTYQNEFFKDLFQAKTFGCYFYGKTLVC